MGVVAAQTSMEMTQEQAQGKTLVRVKLSNGKKAEVKVMPDVAAQTALVKVEVGAVKGEVIGVKKPWWALIASEPAALSPDNTFFLSKKISE